MAADTEQGKTMELELPVNRGNKYELPEDDEQNEQHQILQPLSIPGPSFHVKQGVGSPASRSIGPTTKDEYLSIGELQGLMVSMGLGHLTLPLHKAGIDSAQLRKSTDEFLLNSVEGFKKGHLLKLRRTIPEPASGARGKRRGWGAVRSLVGLSRTPTTSRRAREVDDGARFRVGESAGAKHRLKQFRGFQSLEDGYCGTLEEVVAHEKEKDATRRQKEGEGEEEKKEGSGDRAMDALLARFHLAQFARHFHELGINSITDLSLLKPSFLTQEMGMKTAHQRKLASALACALDSDLAGALEPAPNKQQPPDNHPAAAAALFVRTSIALLPFGVLGQQLTASGLLDTSAGPDPTSEEAASGCVLVDPAGLHHIQPPGGPNGAHGAAGAIYKAIGIDRDKAFPAEVVAAVTKTGDAKYHMYFKTHPASGAAASKVSSIPVIHCVGPDLRQDFDPLRNPGVPYTREQAVDALGACYQNVLHEFVGSGQRSLRLVPVSGGIFAGAFLESLPELTFEALQKAFCLLSEDKGGNDLYMLFRLTRQQAEMDEAGEEGKHKQFDSSGGGGGGDIGEGSSSSSRGGGQCLGMCLYSEKDLALYRNAFGLNSREQEEGGAGGGQGHLCSSNRVLAFRGYEASDGFRGAYYEALVHEQNLMAKEHSQAEAYLKTHSGLLSSEGLGPFVLPLAKSGTLARHPASSAFGLARCGDDYLMGPTVGMKKAHVVKFRAVAARAVELANGSNKGDEEDQDQGKASQQREDVDGSDDGRSSTGSNDDEGFGCMDLLSRAGAGAGAGGETGREEAVAQIPWFEMLAFLRSSPKNSLEVEKLFAAAALFSPSSPAEDGNVDGVRQNPLSAAATAALFSPKTKAAGRGVSLAELGGCMQRLGLSFSDAELAAWFRSCDVGGDQRVSLTEFKNLVKEHCLLEDAIEDGAAHLGAAAALSVSPRGASSSSLDLDPTAAAAAEAISGAVYNMYDMVDAAAAALTTAARESTTRTSGSVAEVKVAKRISPKEAIKLTKANNGSNPLLFSAPSTLALTDGMYEVVFEGKQLGVDLLGAEDPQDFPSVSSPPAGKDLPKQGHLVVSVNGHHLQGSPDTYAKAVEIITSAGRPVVIGFQDPSSLALVSYSRFDKRGASLDVPVHLEPP